jgi:hypothetical protein
MPKEIVQDNIDFMLVAEETVVNNTVKMVATISGTLTSDLTEERLTANIRQMMQNLIKDAKWNYAGIKRSTNSSGLEVIDLQASARVSETENHGLEQRIREVSKPGMSITSIIPDTTPPASMIEQCESKLRTSLLEKAKEELKVINETMSDKFRIGTVSFQAIGQDNQWNLSGSALSNKTATAMSYGSHFDAEDSLGNAVKLTMRASISLRRIVT